MPTLLLAFLTIRATPLLLFALLLFRLPVLFTLRTLLLFPAFGVNTYLTIVNLYIIYLYLFSSDLFQFRRRFLDIDYKSCPVVHLLEPFDSKVRWHIHHVSKEYVRAKSLNLISSVIPSQLSSPDSGFTYTEFHIDVFR